MTTMMIEGHRALLEQLHNVNTARRNANFHHVGM